MCTQRARESFAAALDEGVTRATAHKVAHLLFTHPTFERPDRTDPTVMVTDVNQREWLVRAEFEWLTHEAVSAGRKLVNYAVARATLKYKNKTKTVAPEALQPPPYSTYVTAAHYLPNLTRALGRDAALHTNASKRKGRTAKNDPPVSPKRAITAWFTPRPSPPSSS